jgi:hypothetical protein
MARNILLLGLDPHAIPGIDAAMVDAAIAIGQKRLDDAGLAVDTCLFTPGPAAAPTIVASLTAKPYACIVIGGGVRKPDAMVEVLEQVIALIRAHAPQAVIGFNTNPTTSIDAVLRCLPAEA